MLPRMYLDCLLAQLLLQLPTAGDSSKALFGWPSPHPEKLPAPLTIIGKVTSAKQCDESCAEDLGAQAW